MEETTITFAAIWSTCVTHAIVTTDKTAGALFLRRVVADGSRADTHSVLTRDFGKHAIFAIRRGNSPPVILNLEIAIALNGVGR
ncbi:MAG: hypothetical protein P8Y47_00210 [Alphaproteobacteria bacterium]